VSRHVQDPTIARIAGELLANLDALADEVVVLIQNQIDIYRPGGLVSQADLGPRWCTTSATSSVT
jgi:hypothetical protein